MEKATKPPADKGKSLRVSTTVWKRLKQRALDDGMTVRELMERAVYQYLGTGAKFTDADILHAQAMLSPAARLAHPVEEKHWTPDE